MPWSAQYDESLGIIEITYTGQVTFSDLKEAVDRRISLQKETGAMWVLSDLSEVEIGPPTMDAYKLPARLYTEQHANRDTRIALILPILKEPREMAFFFETACINRGWTVKSFEDRQSAVKWLISDTSSDKAINDS